MKKQKKLIVAIIIFSMMAMYGSVPLASAASLTLAKDVLSDSDLSATATHTVTFTHAINPGAGGYFEVTLPAPFGNITTGTCSGGGATSSPTTETFRCTYAGGIAGGANTITITNVTNPVAAGSQLILIRTYNSSAVEQEKADVMVAIIDDVTMTATVSATLAFTIAGTSTSAVINGVPVSNNSTATTTPFGTLTVGATSTVGQDLTVTTNADNGYIVTVEQNDELTNTTGSNINSFDNATDGTGTTTPKAWENPDGILDSDWTYGHMGLTINDATNVGGSDYTTGGPLFSGLNGTSTTQVMSHTGPADGVTQNKGKASVLYQVQIHALQEAGDYTSTLTYICTPTY